MTDEEFFAICDNLQANPDLAYVHSTGAWLMLAMPDGENFLAVKAQPGENFNTMSDEVLSHYIQEALR